MKIVTNICDVCKERLAKFEVTLKEIGSPVYRTPGSDRVLFEACPVCCNYEAIKGFVNSGEIKNLPEIISRKIQEPIQEKVDPFEVPEGSKEGFYSHEEEVESTVEETDDSLAKDYHTPGQLTYGKSDNPHVLYKEDFRDRNDILRKMEAAARKHNKKADDNEDLIKRFQKGI